MSPNRTTVRFEIEKLAYGGAGVGHLDGKVCFVEDALPGETVEVKIAKNKRRFLKARLLNVFTPSSERREPRCRHFGTCGGCQYQHLSYAEETRWKTIQVQEYLSRHLKLAEDLIAAIVPSPAPYQTRMHFTAHRTKSGKLGYVAKDNRTVFEIKECSVLEPELESVLKESYPAGHKLTFRLSKNKQVVSSTENVLYEVQVGRETVWAHSASFFQVNRAVAAKIGQTLASVVDEVKPAWFADLFSGCALFSRLAAGEVDNLFLVESNAGSFAALEKNFENTAQHVVTAQGDAEELFFQWCDETRPKKVMIFLDPPRQGIQKAFAKKLGKIGDQPCLAYLSCHLGSMARDLERILAAGNWAVEKVIPFDMFPRTKHIEILTVLKPTRKSA